MCSYLSSFGFLSCTIKKIKFYGKYAVFITFWPNFGKKMDICGFKFLSRIIFIYVKVINFWVLSWETLFKRTNIPPVIAYSSYLQLFRTMWKYVLTCRIITSEFRKLRKLIKIICNKYFFSKSLEESFYGIIQV